MKKRLLTLLLVAFVLCTMAINTFAIENNQGLPAALDHALVSKAYPQRNLNTSNFDNTPFYSGKCPWCDSDVTYIDIDIPRDKLFSLGDNPNNVWFKRGSFVVGSYNTRDYGFKSNNFIMAYPTVNVCNESLDEAVVSSYYTTYFKGVDDDSEVLTPFVHHSLNTSNVTIGYYIALFGFDNTVSREVYYSTATYCNYYDDPNLRPSYQKFILDCCMQAFTTTNFDSILYQPYLDEHYDYGYQQGYFDGKEKGNEEGYANGYNQGIIDGFEPAYDNGYNNGYFDGKADGYDNGYNDGNNDGFVSGYGSGSVDGYKDGFEKGTLKGQGMVDWTWTELFDGLFRGFERFINPFMNIGFNSLNISNILGIIGIVYSTFLVLRIIRG